MKPPVIFSRLNLVDALKGYDYCTGNALQCLAEAHEATERGNAKTASERLREAALWLEIELQRFERLNDNCVIAEIDSLPNDNESRARVLALAERIPLWSSLVRTDPSKPLCSVGQITKRAAIETLEVLHARSSHAQ